jgi:hypothetical protein
VKSSKLPDVATSPKAFSRDEILETRNQIRSGNRSRDAAGLSGAVRVGTKVYFLGRWEARDGKPWAEALVDIDLTDKFPEAKLVGRPQTLSLAEQPIADKLFILDGLITYIARKGDHWGIEQCDPRNNRFSFDELGGKLETCFTPESALKTAAANRYWLFIEHTAYGTNVAGRVDLHTRNRKTLAESRAKMRFMDEREPCCIVLSTANSASLLNTANGALLSLAVPCSIRRMSKGIVVWTPVAEPKRAWLYDPIRWEGKAWWNADLSPAPDGG